MNMRPTYEEAEVTKALRLLLEMRDNCLKHEGEQYNDPKRKEKYDALNLAMEAISNKTIPVTQKIDGNTSDGYHTFNELYHHRAVLFSVIVAHHPELSWKSKRHHDGSMYEDMFIVGINTPQGQATYHYDIDPYWDMFKCQETDFAPEWDGHTADDAIERIGALRKAVSA